MSGIIQQLGELIQQAISTLGYPGVALLTFIENLFPPIPSEIVMPFAGSLAASGRFTFFGAVLAGTLGSLIGAVFFYYVGVWADEPVIRRFIRKYGKWFGTSEEDFDRAMESFNKRGALIVFIGRLIPTVRTLISIPAGIDRMPLPKFLLYSTLGTALWTGLLTYAGYLLGENWQQVSSFLDQYSLIVWVGIGLVVVGYIAYRVWKSDDEETEGPAERRRYQQTSED